MNILLLSNHLNTGGVTSYLLSLAKGLKEAGHRVYVASSGGNCVTRFTEQGIIFIPLPARTKLEFNPFYLIPACVTLRRHCREKGIQMMHANTRVTQVLARFVSALTGIPFVSTCHGYFRNRLSRRIFPCWGSRVIAISESVRSHCVDDLGLEPGQVSVVYSGIDLDSLRAPCGMGRQELREKYCPGLAGPLVSVVARLSAEKGQEFLIRAMKTAASRVAGIRLLIVGEGKMAGALTGLVNELGLGKTVTFVPVVNSIREDAEAIMAHFWNPIGRTDLDFHDPMALRKALLDFIADFSNWDNSTKKEYLETARALTQSAHVALGGAPGTRPLVVDPFAGGGSIPLEALRVGADAFASDLNPVAVLLNKVVLEYIPKYGQTLADEVRKWGEWIKIEAEKELGQFYPKDPDGATPIAYLWARTVTCEGPGCGAEVPLMRSMWLAKKSSRSFALRMIRDQEKKRVDFEIIQDVKPKDVGEGTVRRGSATCPVCGYTTPVASTRKQLKARRGGAADARLLCVVTTRPGQQGRFYRLPTERDLDAVRNAAAELERRKAAHTGRLSLVPDEPTEQYHTFVNRGPIYGMVAWSDFFTSRQVLSMTTLVRLVQQVGDCLGVDGR